MALSNVDRELLQRCLARSPNAWEEFVDRFVGLILHVVHHAAESRNLDLPNDTKDDLCSDVFLQLVRDDFAVLRRFRGQSSLATYLAVVARRIVVRKLAQMKSARSMTVSVEAVANVPAPHIQAEFESNEQLEAALKHLSGHEAIAVRMFHIEGKSYQDIGESIGMPENSVGPLLTRAREKLRSSASKP